MTKKEKLIKAGIILFLISLAAFFTYFVYLQILVARGDLIKYEGKWYRKDDWHELYGEYETPAKNTPEEVYKNFRQALLDGNKEKALGFVREAKKTDHEEIFIDEKLKNRYKNLPNVEEIKKVELIGNHASYSYFMTNEKQEIPYYITFIKNRAGYWEIDSI